MSNRDLVNHVALIVDKSSSIADRRLTDAVIKVCDDQIALLAERSKAHDQETRVSVFLFGSDVTCPIWDKDVLRMPSLRGLYRSEGRTKLIDATIQGIGDLRQVPQKHGDHAFLVFVITDGEENASVSRPEHLSRMIGDLTDSATSNWTVAAFVPNELGRRYAEACGFPPGNVSIWETSAAGLDVVSASIATVTASFYAARASGVRQVKNLFTPDTKAIDPATVNRTLRRLDPAQFKVLDAGFPFPQKMEIADFVEKVGGVAYHRGQAYYRLVKPEWIGPEKKILLRHKRTGTVHHGDECRALLKLPDYKLKVNPADTADYDIFVQSTSVNRAVRAGDSVLVLA